MSGFIAAVDRAFNNKRARKVLLALRKPLGLLAGVLIVLNAQRAWFWPALAVAAFGALFQLWCFSCIKTQKVLAVNGPYKLIRNPMYIARLFLVVGCVLLTGNLWLTAVVVVLYYFYMVNRVRREEVKLEEVFGEPYRRYCQSVSRFVPVRKPYPEGKFLYFSRECFLRNHGQWNVLAVAAFFGLVYVVVFVIRNEGG